MFFQDRNKNYFIFSFREVKKTHIQLHKHNIISKFLPIPNFYYVSL